MAEGEIEMKICFLGLDFNLKTELFGKLRHLKE